MGKRWRRFKRRYQAQAYGVALIAAGVILGVVVAGGVR